MIKLIKKQKSGNVKLTSLDKKELKNITGGLDTVIATSEFRGIDKKDIR